ncbi:hypothetical protein JZ751_018513, partial [Albula glossodonta]
MMSSGHFYRQDQKMPKPGDLIEVHRKLYSHWALYIGNGEVIHFAPTSEVAGAGANSLMSVVHDEAQVQRESLKSVVGNDKWCIRNILDHKYEPKDIEEILTNAEQLVGQIFAYNVFTSNCEHFVTRLRYGKPESKQVQDGLKIAGGMVVAGLAVIVLTPCQGLYHCVTAGLSGRQRAIDWRAAFGDAIKERVSSKQALMNVQQKETTFHWETF